MKNGKKLFTSFLALTMSASCFSGTPVLAEEAMEDFSSQFANASASENAGFKTRYWLPNAYPGSSDALLEELEREIKEMSEAGYSTIELASVVDGLNSSQQMALAQGDGEESYLYGSSYWTKCVQKALEAGKKYGVTVDITCGPHWPCASDRVNTSSNAVCHELVYSTVELGQGSSFTEPDENIVKQTKKQGLADEVIENKLLGVYAAQYSSKQLAGSSESSGPFDNAELNRDEYCYSLKKDTMLRLDPKEDGTYDFTAPEDNYVVIQIYERATAQSPSNVTFGNPDTDYRGYALDLFSKAGVDEMIRYFEEDVFNEEIGNLLKEAGGNFFEDSLEMDTVSLWTTVMPEAFKEQNQYDLMDYLPYVINVTSMDTEITADYQNPSAPFVIDQDDDYTTTRIVGDFIRTLSNLYLENHVQAIEAWAQENYGMGYRVQNYGQPIDSGIASYYATVTEGESLGFNNRYDSFRRMAAGRDMAGKLLLSDEIGAVPAQGAWTYGYTDLIKNCNQNYAAGANSIVVHGYSYFYGPESIWPGYHAFANFFSTPSGSRMPQWTQVTDMTEYVARTQFALQTGVQKTDIALYESVGNSSSSVSDYTDTGLTDAGYTYQFLTEGLFTVDEAEVTNDCLNENGPGYKALIIRDETMLPMNVLNKLAEFADAGLPVLFVGRTPVASTSFTENAEEVDAAMEQLLAKENVYKVNSDDEIVEVLKQAGITPDLIKDSDNTANANVINLHRSFENGDIYYLYNESEEDVSVTVTFGADGTPFLLNAWTGEIDPLSQYSVTEDGITMNIDIAGNDAKLIGISKDEYFGQLPEKYVTAAETETVYRDGELVALLTEEGDATLQISDGASCTAHADAIPSSIVINEWDLSVEGWSSAQNPDNAAETKKEVVYDGHTTAVSWKEIEGLGENISGIGTYTTTFMVENAENFGAVLSLPTVADTYQVYLNDTCLPTGSFIDPVLDLSGYLVEGENQLKIVVASSLSNAVNSSLPTIGGVFDEGFLGDGQPIAIRTDNGIIGDTVISFYQEVPLTESALQ